MIDGLVEPAAPPGFGSENPTFDQLFMLAWHCWRGYRDPDEPNGLAIQRFIRRGESAAGKRGVIIASYNRRELSRD